MKDDDKDHIEKYVLMYENYINGNITDHREQYQELRDGEKVHYLIYLFSTSGKEYPKILKSLVQ